VNVKSEDTIRRRLKKLRIAYAKQYVELSQSKKPSNCVYNYEYQNDTHDNSIQKEFERAPRISKTLIVINNSSSIRICTYGSKFPNDWNGDVVCDNDSVSYSCKYFTPKVVLSDSLKNFQNLVSNDKYVSEHYKDVAVLQWVLDERIALYKFSFFEKMILFFVRLKYLIFGSKHKKHVVVPVPRLDGLWDDNLK